MSTLQPALFDDALPAGPAEGQVLPLDWMEQRDRREAYAAYYAAQASPWGWAAWPAASAEALRAAYRRVCEWRDATRSWPDPEPHDHWDRLWWGIGQMITELDAAQPAEEVAA